MKKRISVLAVLVLALILAVAPAVQAAGWMDKVQDIKNQIPDFETKYNNQTVTVPTDMSLTDGTTPIEEAQAATTNFDFNCKIDMQPVRDKFATYIALAQTFGATADAVPVYGEFTVTITYPKSFTLETEIDAVPVGNMTGFQGTAKDNYVDTAREVQEVGNNKVATITLKAKGANEDYVTGAELKTGTALNDMEFAWGGVTVPATAGLYTVTGELTGKSDIGANDTTANTYLATVFYNGKDSQRIRVTSKDSGPSGGGVTSYKVTWKVDGEDYATEKVTSGSKVDANSKTPSDETFDGWYLDEAYTQKVPTGADGKAEVTINKSTTFYGKTSASSTGNKVEWIINGEPVKTETVEDGTTVTVADGTPADRDGYVFDGWYSDPSMTQKITDPTVEVNDDTAFYGKWINKTVPSKLQRDEDGEHHAYVIGYPEGDVRPLNNITRAEVATIFYRLMRDADLEVIYTTDNNFSDVNADDWFNKAVSSLAKGGYLTGYEDGTFKPNAPITRAEFATIAVRFADEATAASNAFKDIDSHWAKDYILKDVSLGWITGYEDGTFRPDDLITRAEAMTIINRVLVRYVNAEGLHKDAKVWPDNPQSAWYFYNVEEATNSHTYDRQADGYNETWTSIIENWVWVEKADKED